MVSRLQVADEYGGVITMTSSFVPVVLMLVCFNRAFCRADTGLLRATPRTPYAVNYFRTGPSILVTYTISYTIVRTVIHT